jgi:hypothetical protein
VHLSREGSVLYKGEEKEVGGWSRLLGKGKRQTKGKTYGASGPRRLVRTKMGVGRWSEGIYVEAYRSWNLIHFIRDY